MASVAERLLAGTNAAQQVRSILLADETLAGISTWADCARGSCGSPTAEMTDFVRANPRNARYHFTDVPLGVHDYVAGTAGTDADDVVQILGQALGVLRGGSDAASNPHRLTQRQALLLVVHLVGDIHQPLHVGSPYVDGRDRLAVPRSEADIGAGAARPTFGGNALTLRTRVLHAWWDFDAVQRAMERAQAAEPRSYAAFLLERYGGADASQTGDVATWPAQWASETLRLAEDVHRGLTIAGRTEVSDRDGSPRTQWSVGLPDDFAERSVDAAERQLAKAGKRLASALQAIWP